MSPEPKKDLVASVRARLLNLAESRGEDLDLVLKRYGIERLLHRLSRSEYRDVFVLKGAMLFELWLGRGHRRVTIRGPRSPLAGSTQPCVSPLGGSSHL